MSKFKYRKGLRLTLISSLAGLVYAFQFYLSIFRGDLSDISVFSDYAKTYNYDYLTFGYERFYTWSQRLWIESATMYFSTHFLAFLGMAALISTVFFISLTRFFKLKSPVLVPLIFMTSFPVGIYGAAGEIPEFVNYLLPMMLFGLAIICLFVKRRWLKCLGIGMMALAVSMEQLALLGLLLTSYVLLERLIRQKKFSLLALIYLLISSFGLALTQLSPGFALRYETDLDRWFPGFDDLTFFEKIGQGYLDTNYHLFIKGMSFIYIFLVVLAICAIINQRYASASISGIIFMSMILNQTSIQTFMTQLPNIASQVKENPQEIFSLNAIYAMGFYSLLLIMVAWAVHGAFPDKTSGFRGTYLVMAGYLARMSMAFSPTLYASSYRTFTPLIFASLMCGLYLIKISQNTKQAINPINPIPEAPQIAQAIPEDSSTKEIS